MTVFAGQYRLRHIAAPWVAGNHQLFTDQYARYRRHVILNTPERDTQFWRDFTEFRC